MLARKAARWPVPVARPVRKNWFELELELRGVSFRPESTRTLGALASWIQLVLDISLGTPSILGEGEAAALLGLSSPPAAAEPSASQNYV